MNEDDNNENLFGILTTFTRKLIDFFFIIIGENVSTNLPMNNIYSPKKVTKLTCLYGTM